MAKKRVDDTLDWREFASRHEGNCFLRHDPLYALNEPIIDAIKKEVPAFFTAEQEAFERDLANTASFGFCHQRVLGKTALPLHIDVETGLPLQGRLKGELDDDTKAMIDEFKEFSKEMLNEIAFDDCSERDSSPTEVIEVRKKAYAGWLIANRQYHRELATLREPWECLVEQRGVFPHYPRWPFFDDIPDPSFPSEFRRAFYSFYRRWGLDSLLTWDWPVPMDPDFSLHTEHDLPGRPEAGVVFFVPWYLLRGGGLNLQGVVQGSLAECEADHLRDWIRKGSRGNPDAMGDYRFARIRWIYRFHELVLLRRYGPACRKRLCYLDRAFATVIHRDEESVKDVRLELKKLLHGR